MTRGALGGLVSLILGLTMGGLGIWVFKGRGAEGFFRKRRGNAFLDPSVTLVLLPFGVGFSLMGTAFLVGTTTFTRGMLLVGLACVATGWVLYFVRPMWARPGWLKGGKPTPKGR